MFHSALFTLLLQFRPLLHPGLPVLHLLDDLVLVLLVRILIHSWRLRHWHLVQPAVQNLVIFLDLPVLLDILLVYRFALLRIVSDWLAHPALHLGNGTLATDDWLEHLLVGLSGVESLHGQLLTLLQLVSLVTAMHALLLFLQTLLDRLLLHVLLAEPLVELDLSYDEILLAEHARPGASATHGHVLDVVALLEFDRTVFT